MAFLKQIVTTVIVLIISFVCFSYYSGRLYYVGPEVEMCAKLAASHQNTEVLFFSGYVNEYFSWKPPKYKEIKGQAIFKDKRVVEYSCKFRAGDINIKPNVLLKGML